MSLSFPAGHIMLQPASGERSRSSLARHRSLSHMHSAASLRPSSPLPGHYRSQTPVDSIHERERNWNKPQPHSHRHDTPSPHLFRHSSLSSIGSTSPIPRRHGRDSPVDVVHDREKNWNSPNPVWHHDLSPRHARNHSFSSPRSKRLSQEQSRSMTPIDPLHERERNWNAAHPVWHNNVSPPASKKSPSVSPLHGDNRVSPNSFHDLSHNSGHVNGYAHSPQSTKMSSTRPFSLHLPERTLRTLSPTPSHDHAYRDSIARHALKSPSQIPKLRKKVDMSPIAVNGSRSHPTTPARTKLLKSSRSVSKSKSVERSTTKFDHEESDHTPNQRVPLPSLYEWPALDSEHSEDTSKPVSNGHNDVETDGTYSISATRFYVLTH